MRIIIKALMFGFAVSLVCVLTLLLATQAFAGVVQ